MRLHLPNLERKTKSLAFKILVFSFCLMHFIAGEVSIVCAFGKLSQVSQAVDESNSDRPKKKSSKKSSSSHKHKHHYSHNDWDDDCDSESFESAVGQLFAGVFLIGASSPWWGPHIATADTFDEPATFLATPYQDGHHGNIDIIPLENDRGTDWQLRFLADYGTDFSGIERIGGHLEFDTSSRFGFDTSWNRFTEDLEPTNDTLWLGDANITYRFAQNEAIQFHTGVGMNWLNDAGRTDIGANFTYGFDLFPQKPWIIRGTMDLGRLGDSSRIHFRGDVGLTWRNFEVFTGYDLERISNVNLQTWTSGIQIRY